MNSFNGRGGALIMWRLLPADSIPRLHSSQSGGKRNKISVFIGGGAGGLSTATACRRNDINFERLRRRMVSKSTQEYLQRETASETELESLVSQARRTHIHLSLPALNKNTSDSRRFATGREISIARKQVATNLSRLVL